MERQVSIDEVPQFKDLEVSRKFRTAPRNPGKLWGEARDDE